MVGSCCKATWHRGIRPEQGCSVGTVDVLVALLCQLQAVVSFAWQTLTSAIPSGALPAQTLHTAHSGSVWYGAFEEDCANAH